MEGEFGGDWTHGYAWLSPLLSTWNYHNIVNQLYSNIKQQVLQNEFSPSTVELRNTLLRACMLSHLVMSSSL